MDKMVEGDATLTISNSILVLVCIKSASGQYFFGIEAKYVIYHYLSLFDDPTHLLKGRFFLFSSKLARF